MAKIDQPLLDTLNGARGRAYRAEDWSDWDLTFLPPDDRRFLFRLLTRDFYGIVVPYPQAPKPISALSKFPGVQRLQVLGGG
jgi:hypothetical protein